VTLAPLIFALVMWFVGTGAVVWLDSRPHATFRTSFRAAGIVALAATAIVWTTRSDPSPVGAYIGFAAAIAIWGWHELGFLMGFVAGPNHAPRPADATGWGRFRLATATVIHHEVALAATTLALAVLTWDQSNQAATLTFALLFALRLSAKLNLYLGVPNLSDEIFPEHLAYLKTHFGRPRAMNALFPFSLLLAGGAFWWAWSVADATTGGAAITATLIAGLAALGFVEHLFLVLPLRDGAMWRWASNRAVKPVVITGGEPRHGQ
jgi:putative photosynthetic complex assembly protein 2